MKERLDAFLRRLSFRGKSLSLHRLNWWLVIILTRLFGRRVEIEDSGGRTIRVFPIVWNGKVHLLGIEHLFVRIDFSSEYTLHIRKCPEISILSGKPVTQEANLPKITHIVLGHLAAPAMDTIMEYLTRLAGSSYSIVLAHGGKQADFDQVRHSRKVFIDDPRLRGLAHRISHFGMMAQTRNYLDRQGINPDWIFVSDYDFLPTQPAYLDKLITLMREQGAGMGGKLIIDASFCNHFFMTQALHDGIFDRRPDLNVPGGNPVYHALGCAYLFHRDCFNSILALHADLEDMNVELAIPTAAHLQGFRILSFDKFGESFRRVHYRPVIAAGEAVNLARSGVEFLHPVKETDAFIRDWMKE